MRTTAKPYVLIQEDHVTVYNSYDIFPTLKKYGFTFDGRKLCWKIHKNMLTDEIVNFLRKYSDEATYTALENILKAPLQVPILSFVTPQGVDLFQHQIEAASRIVHAFNNQQKGFLLADAPRVGKTYSILSALKHLNKRAIILSPVSVVSMWENQSNKWGIQTICMSYENFRIINNGNGNEKNKIKLQELKNFTSDQYILVLDEAHKVKNKSSKIYQVVAEYAKSASFVISATGTPFQNSPDELQNIMNVTKLDQKIVNIAIEWEKIKISGRRWIRKPRWSASQNKLKQLRRILESSLFYIRRELKDVVKSLPKLSREVIEINSESMNYAIRKIDELLETLERDYYNQDKKDMAHKVSSIRNGLFLPSDLGSIFNILSELRSLIGKAKIEILDEYVVDAVASLEEDEGILFFAHHKEVREKILSILKENEITCAEIAGDTPNQARQEIASKFQNGAIKALVLSTRAAGEGLTLSRAGVAVFIEIDWNPAVLTQAENRIMNIADHRNKIVRYIIAPHNIERRMIDIINDKAIAAELVYASEDSMAKIQD